MYKLSAVRITVMVLNGSLIGMVCKSDRGDGSEKDGQLQPHLHHEQNLSESYHNY